MFHKMKLKPYLLSAFCVMILLAGIITALGIIGLINTSNNTDALVNQVLDAESAVKTCRIETNVAARDLREMLLTNDTARIAELKENINSSMESITEQIAVFKKAHGTSDGLADQYESAFEDWFQIAAKVMDEVDQGDTETARQTILNECSPALEKLVSVVQNIDSTIATQKQEAETHTMTMLRVFIIATLAVFVVALAMALYIAFRTTSLLTKTVEKAKDAVSELSHGNLKAHMDYEGANEFGELAEKMNFSFQELSKYVDAIDYGMGEFSKGNFTCTCPIQFIGDFAHIQQSIEHFQEKIRNVLEELEIPVQREPAPHGVALGVIKGEDDEHENGGVEEEKHDEDKKSGEDTIFLHSSTASPSPSPKRFISPMLNRTMIIMTREMAEPRWGL